MGLSEAVDLLFYNRVQQIVTQRSPFWFLRGDGELR